MIDYVNELRKAYNGDAWHGNNISALIAMADVDQVFKHPISDAHSISEIVLHLTSWTQEVASRLMGENSREPINGDWPLPKAETYAEWDFIVSDFNLENEKLISLIIGFSKENWLQQVKRDSDGDHNYAELLNGLIQHHAYHAGQIALLLKLRS